MRGTKILFMTMCPSWLSGARGARLLLALAAVLAWAAPASAQSTVSGVFHLVWRVSQDPGVPVEVSYHLSDDQGRTYALELEPEQVRAFGGPVGLNRRRVQVTIAPLAMAEGESGGGSRLRVLSLAPDEPAAPMTAALNPAGAVQSGSRPYATILCRFADSVTVPHPAEWYRELLTGTAANGLDHYWREVSDGRINLDGGVVVGWVDLPRTRAGYFPGGLNANPDWSAMVADCTGAADAAVDFRKYAGVNMQFNMYMPASWGGSRYVAADGVNRVMPMTWMAPWAGHSVYAHEMGHSFGLPHSSGPYTATYDSRWDVMSNSYIRAVGGQWIGQHTVIYHKDILGWIPAAQRYLAAPGSVRTLVLNRSETPGTTSDYQMAQIPLPGGMFYTVEVRRKVGYDLGLPGEGVVIHRVDPALADRSAQVMDADGNGDPNDAGAIWLPGERFVDAANQIAVSVDSAAGTGFQVTIARSAPVVMVSDSLRRLGVVQGAYADTLRAEGGVGTYTWTVVQGALPPGLALSGASGVLSGSPTQAGNWSFTARAASGATSSAQRQFRVNVVEPLRIVSDSVRVPARLGMPHADTLRATGALGTYTWSVRAGAVPPGLVLDGATGVLSGTATQEGTHRFTVGAASATLSAQLQLVVRVARPLALASDSVRRAATMGAQYADTLRAQGGLEPTVWRIADGRLPAGVALDSLTGAFSGVPTEAGTFRLAVTARSGTESVQGVARIAVGKPQLQPAAVVDQLLMGTGLAADQAHFLDLLGNRNGRVDVGDVRAWLADNQQINLSEHPVLQQIMAEPADPGAAQPRTPEGKP
jgi:M6 family metalloprotease-like protein